MGPDGDAATIGEPKAGIEFGSEREAPMRGKVAAKIGPQKDPPVEKSLFFAEPSGCPGDQPPRLDGLRQASRLVSFVSSPGSGNGKGKFGRPK